MTNRHALLATLLVAAACSSDPTAPPETPASSLLTVGETTICAGHVAGSIYCWGESRPYTQLGESVDALFVPAPRLMTLEDVAAFSTGPTAHMCAIHGDGSATCWGRNTHGQVGSGALIHGSLRTALTGNIAWKEISAGRISTCGVSQSGAAYCWGSNNAGEVGTPTVAIGATAAVPTPIDGSLTFQSIAAGWRHSCGIATTGAAYCWGENTRGQLGIGAADSTVHRAPQLVAGGHTFVQLAAGGRHTCGITTAGRAYCWGDNSTAQLGDGTLVPRAVPTAVAGAHTFRSITTSGGFGGGAGVALPSATQGGIAHSCALTSAGVAYCWGWNGAGQVGNPTAANFQLAPLVVAGNHTFDVLQAGGAMTCGMQGSRAWCWGANAVGQLGNGGIASAATPTPVAAPFDS